MVVTRPARQASGVTKKVQRHGGHVLPFPVIEIAPPMEHERLRSVLRRLQEFDWLVFISANAVVTGLDALREAGVTRTGAKVAAVGSSTARELRERGWLVDVTAKPPFTSETLLQESVFRHVQGERFLIFRGEGGRELLRDTLIERGAEVDYAECYRRAPASSDPERLRRAWSRDQLDVIMLTSVEGLKNLIQIAGQRNAHRLFRTPVVVAGERVAAEARNSGWRAPIITADNATDDAMLKSLQMWRSSSARAD